MPVISNLHKKKEKKNSATPIDCTFTSQRLINGVYFASAYTLMAKALLSMLTHFRMNICTHIFHCDEINIPHEREKRNTEAKKKEEKNHEQARKEGKAIRWYFSVVLG